MLKVHKFRNACQYEYLFSTGKVVYYIQYKMCSRLESVEYLIGEIYLMQNAVEIKQKNIQHIISRQ